MPPCVSMSLGSVFMAQPLQCRSSLCAQLGMCPLCDSSGSGIWHFSL